MKRTCLTLTLALLVSLLLAVPAAGTGLGYVTDDAGILTDGEWQELEEMAATVSDAYGFGVYAITVDTFRDFTDSPDVFDAATSIYTNCDLGLGGENKGVLLLLSMTERDFSLITYSDYGNFVFDEETREWMTSYFLDDFANDDWYTGFADYVAVCDSILADGPDKLDSAISAKTGMIFLIPLLIAAVGIIILNSRMKSVAKATEAEVYTDDGLQLTDSHDLFTHSTETRRKRKEESNNTRSKSSGGFGGTSGKF